MAEKIVAVVDKLYGKCKFWKQGDKLVFRVDTKSRMIGLDMEETDGRAVCVAALATIYPYILTRKTWTSKMEYDYYRCPDPGRIGMDAEESSLRWIDAPIRIPRAKPGCILCCLIAFSSVRTGSVEGSKTCGLELMSVERLPMW